MGHCRNVATISSCGYDYYYIIEKCTKCIQVYVSLGDPVNCYRNADGSGAGTQVRYLGRLSPGQVCAHNGV